MKHITRILLLLAVFCLVFAVCACEPDFSDSEGLDRSLIQEYREDIDSEMHKSFLFFWNEANTTEGEAYGLIPDRWPSQSSASIASVGFGLTGIPIGVEKGWITESEGRDRAIKTLDTLLSLENVNGFFYHFLNMRTGEPDSGTEVSNIDTALLICGALTAGEYFGGEAEEKALALYSRINWKWFVDDSRDMFYMSYKNDRFAGHWDFYAEQLMMYILGAGAPNEEYRTDKALYEGFRRAKGSYRNYEYIYSWFGSLFTYQYSHGWIDFRGIVDGDGVNWYDNSVVASEAAYTYCVDNKETHPTYSEVSWGLTACDTAKGYNGFLGTPPRGYSYLGDSANYAKNVATQGTVAPTAAIGSVVFTSAKSLAALRHYNGIAALSRQYGLVDAYQLQFDDGKGSDPYNWYAYDCIGIDKGIGLVMLANYENDLIWNLFMQSEYVQNGLAECGFTSVS